MSGPDGKRGHAEPSEPERPVDVALVLAMTERVEAAISRGDWQEAADLEAQRRAALVALLERGRGAEPDAGLRERLAAIATRTHRMIGEVHHHRRTVLREASMIRRGRRAADEYAQNSTA